MVLKTDMASLFTDNKCEKYWEINGILNSILCQIRLTPKWEIGIDSFARRLDNMLVMPLPFSKYFFLTPKDISIVPQDHINIFYSS